jgi:Relaxase/Mobilisation nuclease domain
MNRAERGSGGGSSSARMSSRLSSGGGPQAFVKIVRNGGTKTSGQIKSQMDYLSRDGEMEVQRSERHFGVVMDDADQDAMAQDWTVGPSRDTGLDLTTHFVVSYPAGTDASAAQEASRAWASEMFDSGNHGDVYDYYSVFHTDKPHPHMHVVVKRRGIERGEWLKISNRGEINYDMIRDIQVDTARRFGIDMQATPREARGLRDRPITDAEYRRAEREGRDPQPRAHSEDSANATAAAIESYASQIALDAAALQGHAPEVAERMGEIATALRDGLTLEHVVGSAEPIDMGEAAGLSTIIAERRNDVNDGFTNIDRLTALLPADSLQRVEIERQTSDWRGQIAPFIAGTDGFAEQVLPDGAGRYRGFVPDPHDEVGQLIAADAQELVRGETTRSGLDPEIMLARYNSNNAVPRALADQWRETERAQMNPDAGPDDIQRSPEGHHARIEAIYANARALDAEIRAANRLDEDGLDRNNTAPSEGSPVAATASDGTDGLPEDRITGKKRAHPDETDEAEASRDETWTRNVKHRQMEEMTGTLPIDVEATPNNRPESATGDGAADRTETRLTGKKRARPDEPDVADVSRDETWTRNVKQRLMQGLPEIPRTDAAAVLHSSPATATVNQGVNKPVAAAGLPPSSDEQPASGASGESAMDVEVPATNASRASGSPVPMSLSADSASSMSSQSDEARMEVGSPRHQNDIDELSNRVTLINVRDNVDETSRFDRDPQSREVQASLTEQQEQMRRRLELLQINRDRPETDRMDESHER